MIYVMGTRPDGIVKIGTATNPTARLRQIQAGHPEPLRVLFEAPGDRRTEAQLHTAFASRRVSIREWFDFSGSDAVAEVSAALAVEAASAVVADEADSARGFRIGCFGAKGGSGTSTSAVVLANVLAEEQNVTLYDCSVTQGAVTWQRIADRHDGYWPERLRVVSGHPADDARGVEIVDFGRVTDWNDRTVADCNEFIFCVQAMPMDIYTAAHVALPTAHPIQDALRVVVTMTDSDDPSGHVARAEIEQHVGWARFCNTAIPWREERARDAGFAGPELWAGAYGTLARELTTPKRVVL